LLGRKIFKGNINNEVTNNESWWKPLEGLFGSPTNSGEIVTADNAFSNLGIVFACVVIRSNALAKLPLQVFRKTSTGRERDSSHPITYLLEKRPNKGQSPSQLKKFIETSLMLWGNAYIRLDFDRRGQIMALSPLDPGNVTIKKLAETGDYFYQYIKDNGEVVVYSEDDIIHIPYISQDGKVGKAPLTVARENAGNLLSMQKFEGKFYKNGTLAKGALKYEGSLDEEVKTLIKNEWRRINGGADNSGDIAVLDNGLEWQNISMPLKDAEFVLTKEMNKTDIATIFNVPVFMLNNLEKATFNNFEQMKLLYAENVLMPDCIAIEEEINYKAFLRGDPQYVKFNMNGAMRGDGESRVKFYKGLMDIGGILPDEVRQLEDFDLYGTPEANEPYMTRNLSPMSVIKENAMKGGGGNEQTTEPED
jgi:HK97 family phage portal protein